MENTTKINDPIAAAHAAEAKLAAIARTRRPTPEESAEAVAAYRAARRYEAAQ